MQKQIKLSQVCDAIIVINLDQRTDKLEKFMQEFGGSVDVPIYRESGVYGRDIPVETINQKYLHPSSKKYWLFKTLTDKPNVLGAIGCSVSHANALRRAKELGLKRPLIMEDDSIFRKSLSTELINDILIDMPNDFDLAYLYGMIPMTDKVYKFSYTLENLHWVQVLGGVMTTSAYIVDMNNESFISELIDNFDLGGRLDAYLALEVQQRYRCLFPRTRPIDTYGATDSDINSEDQRIMQQYFTYNPLPNNQE